MARVPRGRPDPRWDTLVEEEIGGIGADAFLYTEFAVLANLVKIKLGHNPTMSHARRRLCEANNGMNEVILNFNFDEYRQEATARKRAYAVRQEEARKQRELDQADDDVRIKRRPLLVRHINELRTEYAEQHQAYHTREGVLNALLSPSNKYRWDQRQRNKDVALYLGEVTAAWMPLDLSNLVSCMRPGFIDLSHVYGSKLLWDHVRVLEPLEQTPDARGNVKLRTNSRTVVKLRKAKHCALEALLFATGQTKLADLNLTGFVGDKYDEGITLHEANVRLRATPYVLYDADKVSSKRKRSGGAERRTQLSLFDIIKQLDTIIVAAGVVRDEDGRLLSKHAFVWDGWRRLFFVGPGEFDDRGLDGALLMEEADCKDAAHVDAAHGLTATAYLHKKFGISEFTHSYALMVRKAAAGTQLV